MNRRYLPMLVLLALIWGSSFMFIKIAVRELDPATLVFGRLTVAALVLGVVVLVAIGRRAAWSDLRAFWLALVVVGLLNTAVPFWLLSWGETRIDSGLASIIQASVPIFNALLAYGFFREQRVTGGRLVGVVIGFVGVAVLVGAQPEAKVLGALAVVGMALCYGAGGLLARRYLSEVQPPVVAFGTTAIAALVMMPAGVALAPDQVPGWKTFASILVLGVVGDGGRLLALLHAGRRRRVGVCVARDVPRAADRARLRRDLPRRALRRLGVRRPGADPRGSRARHAHEAAALLQLPSPPRWTD